MDPINERRVFEIRVETAAKGAQYVLNNPKVSVCVYVGGCWARKGAIGCIVLINLYTLRLCIWVYLLQCVV